MTYAQLTILAEVAGKSVSDLLYQGYTDNGAVDLEVGFEREQADAAGKLAYDAVMEAGEQFVQPLRVIGSRDLERGLNA